MGRFLSCLAVGIAIVSLVACEGCSPARIYIPPSGVSDREQGVREEIIRRTCKVICGFSTGSGSRVYSNIVVTAHHVIESSLREYDPELDRSRPPRVNVQWNDSSMSTGWTVLWSDQEIDIAILQAPGVTFPGRRNWIGWTENWVSGDKVYCSGYPWGSGPILTSGYISRYDTKKGFLWVSVNALPGSSGSGVYSIHGEFVGVLVRGLVSGGQWSQFTFQVIPLSRIESILESLKVR